MIAIERSRRLAPSSNHTPPDGLAARTCSLRRAITPIRCFYDGRQGPSRSAPDAMATERCDDAMLKSHRNIVSSPSRHQPIVSVLSNCLVLLRLSCAVFQLGWEKGRVQNKLGTI